MKKTVPFALVFFSFFLLLQPPLKAQWPAEREPLGLEQMEEYRSTPFTAEGFEKIQNGMDEIEVLKTLGRPESVKKQRRRHNRWSAHYFYPGGHVVNFRNGLVVGKEKG